MDYIDTVTMDYNSLKFNENIDIHYGNHISTYDREIIKETIRDVIRKLNNIPNYILDDTKMANSMLTIAYSNIENMQNLCVECNVDMGDCNPRQLCGKTKCNN
jgi:DNA-directed RNA polymerase specialized sigma subunit